MATPGISQVLHTSETKLRGNEVAKEFAEYDGFFRNDKGLLSDESADKRKVRSGRPPLPEAAGRHARLTCSAPAAVLPRGLAHRKTT